MEPLSPNDPVFKLLGKAKPVDPRPNFTQNVLRAIRQEPQRESVWERLRYWLATGGTPRAAWAGSGVAALLAVAVWSQSISQQSSMEPAGGLPTVTITKVESMPSVAAPTAVEEAFPASEASASTEPATVASEFESMDQLSLLLAQQDTSALT
ncbi:MAG TPA: hypothetical protein VK956_10405, partial [Verrucomicrobium sp.]|nr:hypothetical protein [Verrucomicrobium sp.]